jgi:glycogen debranching enzyme
VAELQKLKENEIFAVTNREGDIPADSTEGQGLYFSDTRFLSVYEVSCEGIGLQLLGSAGELNFMSSLQFGNLPVVGKDGQRSVPARTISVRRNRFIENGLHERIGIRNFNPFPVAFSLQITIGSDFRDMFDVHDFVRPAARGWESEPNVRDASVTLRYTGLDGVVRSTRVSFDRSPANTRVQRLPDPHPSTAPSDPHEERVDVGMPRHLVHLDFPVELSPRGTWSMTVHIVPTVGENGAPGPFPNMDDAFRRILAGYREWESDCTHIWTDNAVVNGFIRQSQQDLRLTMNHTPTGLLPVAGIPWFAVPFGRDSLITSLQTLALNPGIATGTLRFLAHHQGATLDPWRDEEPGKILHELRTGELATLREVPHTPYYATLDATPLFVYLTREVIRWTGDWSLADELRPNLERALEWIHDYGDRDGDGLLEYATRSPMGMRHHAWKDSWDSVQFPDGRQAEVPIAPIEVQAYAYAAELAMADFYRHWGDDLRARHLEERARAREVQFDRLFWLESEGFYAQALDASKEAVPAITSNPGHCLLMGIVPPHRAAAVTTRLMQEDMLSGWGIRTLSERFASFNPMSYHNGSVWPHDNSIIAAGLRRMGADNAALRVIEQVFDAAFRFPDRRLPELYCGFGRDRQYHSAPAAYPTACSPQAWAAGTPFLMLQAMAGLQPDLPNHRLYMRPALLNWLDELHFENLALGPRRLSLHIWRDKGHIKSAVEGADGLQVISG